MPDNIERQIQQLYEVASLTDELRDEAAKILLRWGEEQVQWLAMGGVVAGDFEENCGDLRSLIRRINRFAGRRSGMDPDKQREAMDKIVGAALNLGYTVHVPDLVEYLQQPATDDEVKTLQDLIALLKISGQINASAD